MLAARLERRIAVKDNLSEHQTSPPVMPFTLAQTAAHAQKVRPKLAGFAKVLAGGRVVGLNKDAPFVDRMIGFQIGNRVKDVDGNSVEQLILESVATNLEAGVKLLDKQELVLARMGGRLSEIALALNRARGLPDKRAEAQSNFLHARDQLRSLAKETFDHTALFSMGPSKPVIVAVPGKSKWEGLSIDRCDLLKPGLQSIDRGKVCPDALGLLLDPQTIARAFSEWRTHCATNRMQWHLLYDRWQGMVRTLKHFLGGKHWSAPPIPNDGDDGPLSRPHLDN